MLLDILRRGKTIPTTFSLIARLESAVKDGAMIDDLSQVRGSYGQENNITALSFAMINKMPHVQHWLKDHGAHPLLANFGMIPTPVQMECLYHWRANFDSKFRYPGFGLDFEYGLGIDSMQKELEKSLSNTEHALPGITGIDSVLLDQTLQL